MKPTTAQRFGSLGKSFGAPAAAAAVIGAALLASDTSDTSETAWSPAAACLLPDVLPVAGTLLSYGGDRQLAAGGTVTHSGAFHLTGDSSGTAGKVYLGSVTPSATNYTIGGYGGNTWINAPTNTGYVHFGSSDNWGAAVTGSSSSFPNQLGMLNGFKLGWGDNPASTLDAYFVRNSASSIGLKGSGGIDAAVTCGTITASGVVHLAGALTVGGVITIPSTSYFKGNASQGYRFNDSTDTFRLLTILDNGNIGIGTISPTNRLHVVSASSSTAGLLVTGGSTYEGGASSGEIRLGHGADYGLISYGAGSGDLVLSNAYNANAGDIIFRTKTNGTPINALTITGAGAATFAGAITASGKFDSNPLGTYFGLAEFTGAGNGYPNMTLTAYGHQFEFYLDGPGSGDVYARCTSAFRVTDSVNQPQRFFCGPLQETPTQSALDPTTTNIPSGKRQGWYNSTLAEFRDWVNIGGTLLKSAAYT